MTSPKIAVLSDRFDQGSINGNLWSIPAGTQTPTLTTMNVDVNFTAPQFAFGGASVTGAIVTPVLLCEGSSDGASLVQSVSTYDLTSSGLSVELVDYKHVGSSNAYFQLTDGSGNFLQWWLDNSGNLDAGTPSAGDARVATAPVDYADYRFLRIRESGGTVYFDYSPDGINWTNAVNISNPFTLTDLYVEIGLGSGENTPNPYVVWANVDYVL